MRAASIWEFTRRKWIRQIDKEGSKEFIKNSKHGSLSNFMVKGKQVEFSMMAVAKILQLPVEGSNLIEIPPISEEEASYMFEKKAFSVGSGYALNKAKKEWALGSIM